MTEKELANALLKLDATQISGASDARELTWKVLDQDRRRVRWWLAATIALWSLAAFTIVGAFVAYGFVFPAIAQVIHEAGPAEGLEQTILVTAALGKVNFFVAISVLALVLAILATLFLVLSTRRATLRQMNASLIEIAEQLKRLTPS